MAPAPTGDASRWRPYATAGPALILASVHDAGEYDSKQTHLALNAGAGVKYAVAEWFAIRADLRWFHAFVGEDPEGGYAGDYDFGRLALGVTFSR